MSRTIEFFSKLRAFRSAIADRFSSLGRGQSRELAVTPSASSPMNHGHVQVVDHDHEPRRNRALPRVNGSHVGVHGRDGLDERVLEEAELVVGTPSGPA